MLGVCYGHQLMAAAFGGHVDFHPEGRESGTLAVRLTETGRADALLGTLPERFYAHLTHAQSVLEAPSDAQVLAFNDHDANQRSEEHTSELQSRGHLVCRLLLEKKKKH